MDNAMLEIHTCAKVTNSIRMAKYVSPNSHHFVIIKLGLLDSSYIDYDSRPLQFAFSLFKI